MLPLSAENNAQLHDDMTDRSKVSAHSENRDIFESHAETGLSVAGKTDGEDGYISYKVYDSVMLKIECF